MSVGQRIVLGVTGATGAVYGLRMLQVLRELPDWETHLVVSEAGALNIQHELKMKRRDFQALADVCHDIDDVGASIASGAFPTAGMIVAPCSMKTLASIAHAYADNLIARAADVTLKERRRLVLVTREAPLNLAHLRNMVQVTEMGGIVFPPMPAFYGPEKSLRDLIDETVGRILNLFGIEGHGLYRPWPGLKGGV